MGKLFMVEAQDHVPTRPPALALSAKARDEGWIGDRRVYLTALKIAKEVGGAFLGPLFSGGVTLLEAIADAADDAELEANFEELRDLSTRSDQKLRALAALAQFILLKQDEIARRLDQQGPPAAQPIDEIAKATALVAYNAEIAQRFFMRTTGASPIARASNMSRHFRQIESTSRRGSTPKPNSDTNATRRMISSAD